MTSLANWATSSSCAPLQTFGALITEVFGVTGHWIDPSSLRCRSASLTCERMTRRHTYNAVAAKLNAVHTAYCISIKVVMTVTDNGSNFVKAFKKFACDSSSNDAHIVSFVEMSRVLSPVNDDDDDDYYLPLISSVLRIL